MEKILLVGPYPEPKGGVSIHLQRLSKLLSYKYKILRIDESPIIKEDIFNIRSFNIFKYITLINGSNIVHIQSSIDYLRILHITFAKIFKKEIVLTLHSWRNKSNLKEKLLLFLIKYVDKVIVVNNDIAINLNLKKYFVIPAFLPPFKEELKHLPEDLSCIIGQKKKEKFFIVSSNAYQLVDFNGEDLYGLDLFINLAEANKDLKIFFIFQLAAIGNSKLKQKYKNYLEIIENKKLSNMLLYVNPISFVSLIDESDLTLRLTNTDGDALSIRESLYLKTPIIASDVVNRPEGTILFRNRDMENLNKVFHEVFIKEISRKMKDKNTYKSKQSFVDCYNKIYFEQ